MRSTFVVHIALLGLRISIFYRHRFYYGIGTCEAPRHLCQKITLGYMNVSTVALSPAYRKGQICAISQLLNLFSETRPSQTD